MTHSAASKFAKGSGVYTCRCCGHKTRSTDRGDNENVELCADCYDLSGFENQISDNGIETLTEAEINNIRVLAKAITDKGGKLDFAYPELLTVEAPATEQAAETLGFYLVTVTGPADFEALLLPVEAVKSSQARRLAKAEFKAAGLNLAGLTFNARKA